MPDEYLKAKGQGRGYKQKPFSGFLKTSAFTKNGEEEYTPQSKKKKEDISPQSKYSPGAMPQSKQEKASIHRLEGEIEGIFDNEYMEAKEDGNKTLIKRYENRMLSLKKQIEKKGGKYTHIDMSNFGK